MNIKNCLKVAQSLKNRKLSLDCLLCLGYIAYIADEYKLAKNYFHKAFSVILNLTNYIAGCPVFRGERIS